MKKILIIGCGSIGQRHIRAILSLKEKIEIAAFRTKKGHYKALPEDIGKNIIEFSEINEALNWLPTHVIISNPTSLHAEYIDLVMKNNCKIFVEKPLVNDISEITPSMEDMASKILVVGFNLRFHSVIQRVKAFIENKDMGEIVHANISVGHYLPFWHPYEDYRNSYYSRKDLGGGVLRTLSHELDLIQYFFGDVLNVTTRMERISKLEIDVDDCVDSIMETEKCKRVVLHMDYLSPIPQRKGSILLESGLLEYDYFNQEIFFTSYDHKERKRLYKGKDTTDKQYVEQMKDFLNDYESSTASKFKESINIMKIIDRCERSNGNMETV